MAGWPVGGKQCAMFGLACRAALFTVQVRIAILIGSGDVAQLGERRVRNAKVGSSILLVSTIYQALGNLCRALFVSAHGFAV